MIKYYKNITFFIFLVLIVALFIAALFPNPTSNLILMLFIGFVVIYQTYAVLKGPEVKKKPTEGKWYEHD